MAREHGILAKNGGQIVKEFAKEKGIDTTKLDGRRDGSRMRAKKLKMPGGKISVPCHKTQQAVKHDWQKMIESGQLTLGEPCSPYKLTRYTVVHGEIKQTEVEVYGRKISLYTIRKALLLKQEKYMRLHTDEQIVAMTRDELISVLQLARQAFDNTADDNKLRELLIKIERTRTLAIWHDHSTLLGRGYVLITAKVIYDTAVFKSQHEIESSQAHAHNIQSEIEQPQLHMLALCSSSVEDQAALIVDRKQCIQELSITLHATNGVPITMN